MAVLSLRRTRQIMARNLGLRFKRTKTLAARANSVCCRYQRQQFALRLLEGMMAGKRILNQNPANEKFLFLWAVLSPVYASHAASV